MKKKIKFLFLILCLSVSFLNVQQANAQTALRVYEKNNYTQINPGEAIPIYKRELFMGGKGFQTRIQYYFSKDSTSAIFPLTILNLKTAFADDPSFREWIDIYFHSDDELLRYDYYQKIYFLNKVYLISKNNPIKTN